MKVSFNVTVSNNVEQKHSQKEKIKRHLVIMS